MPVQLSDRTLNRTLWVRQHLVATVPPPGGALTDPMAMVEHLLGLQAQENLPPYLSLAARMPSFDPVALSTALRERRAVRMLTMRGTVHLLSAADALQLRPWLQPMLEKRSRSNQGSRAAHAVATEALDRSVREALADGPLPVARLGDELGRRHPDVPTAALRSAARDRTPLAQVPPRGLWRRSGGVVYERVTSWLDRPFADVDSHELVRRYLRAFGPAAPADMTSWSGVTGLGPVFRAMRDELVEHRNADGKALFDVPDGVLADPDLELPPLVLGNFDNLWLAHADRRRIATDEKRRAWVGANGGVGAAVFVDGMLEAIWRDDRSSDPGLTTLRRLTRAERAGVDDDIARVRAFLGTAADQHDA